MSTDADEHQRLTDLHHGKALGCVSALERSLQPDAGRLSSAEYDTLAVMVEHLGHALRGAAMHVRQAERVGDVSAIDTWRRPTDQERQVLAPLLDGEVHELTEAMDEVLLRVPDHRVLVSTYGLASRVRLKPEGRRWLGGEA